jgi:hypothetical protein
MGVRFSTTDTRFELDLPAWAVDALNDLPTQLSTVEARMAAVIEFARRNVRERTGGPFASGIFERDSGRLVVIGVNRVMARDCSSAHAEVMAFSLAQHILGTWDLGSADLPAHQMVNNWRPCAMCSVRRRGRRGSLAWRDARSSAITGFETRARLAARARAESGRTSCAASRRLPRVALPQVRERLKGRARDMTRLEARRSARRPPRSPLLSVCCPDRHRLRRMTVGRRSMRPCSRRSIRSGERASSRHPGLAVVIVAAVDRHTAAMGVADGGPPVTPTPHSCLRP